MADNFTQNIAPQVVGSVVQVTGDLFGKTLVDDLRKRWSPRRQEERGDHFMDQSRDLLQKHLEIIPPAQKESIGADYDQFV